MTNQNDENTRVGLWAKDGFKGWGSGKPVVLEAGSYWVNLYANDKAGNDKRPDYQLVLKPAEERPTSNSSSGKDEVPF